MGQNTTGTAVEKNSVKRAAAIVAQIKIVKRMWNGQKTENQSKL